GADVVVTDINIDAARQTALEIKKQGRVSFAVKMDVCKSTQVKQAVKEIIGEFKGIDILINNAGINRRVPAEKMSEIDWREVINVDLTGVFFCSQIVGRQMIKQRGGKIINIASISGMIANRGMTQAAYCAAKGGVISLTKALAMEWAKYNIRVNSISPGMTRTPLVEDDFIKDKEKYEEIITDTPMRRFGEPMELGPAVVYLSSKASSFITGENLVIDGGYTVL
ncbi:unnamed protein product, partial [marine sediment metagenome]